MKDAVLEELFNDLDQKLSALALSDSTLEYSPHIREPFDQSIGVLNEIKMYLGVNAKKIESYFEIR